MAAPASSPAHFRVTLDGFDIDIPGAFMTHEGGDNTAEARRYRPGGQADEEVAGGPTTREDVVVTREWRRDRDLEIWLWGDRNAGRARGNVTIQPLDDAFNAYGDPFAYPDALLLSAKKPNIDSDGGDDVGKLELTFAVSGKIG